MLQMVRQISINDLFVFFVNNYGVDKQSIIETFNSPDKSQRISSTRTLFYKKFKNKANPHLLICVKENDYENRLSFAFWLPEHTLLNNASPESALISFCESFGCVITLGHVSKKYIHAAEIEDVNENNIDTRIVTDVWDGTPIFRHYIAKLRWSHATLTHIFSINQYKYQRWYRNTELEEVAISSEWSDFLARIIDNLNPIQKTKLEIIPSKRNPRWDIDLTSAIENSNDTFISFPKLYKHELKAITNSLLEGGNVYVSPKSDLGCVFCGNKSRSQEHILPTWFRSYFSEYSFDSITHTIKDQNFFQSFEYGLTKGKESSYGITTYDVCIKCNNEWMSDLEKDVKAIITSDSKSLKDSSKKLSLTDEESHLLSRWLICKTLLLGNRVRILPPIRKQIIRDLKDGKIDDGFWVEILATERFGLNYQIAIGPPFVRLEKMEKALTWEKSSEFFVAVLHIGQFFYRVSYWPYESELPRLNLWPGNTLIYPFHSNSSMGDANELNSEKLTSNSVLGLYLNSLGIGDIVPTHKNTTNKAHWLMSIFNGIRNFLRHKTS